MKEIILNSLELKTFTEQDALDYCLLNNINPDNVFFIYLEWNKLTDISGIRLFKNLNLLNISYNNIINISALKDLNNLEYLDISCNQITDILYIQYLIKLQTLNIKGLELESDQIEYINSLKNLKKLFCNMGFKDMSILNKLNKNIKIYE